MKKLIIYLSIIISFYSYSQDKNLESDTIYIYFKNSCKYEKINIHSKSNDLSLKIYEFDLGDNYNKINFISSKYLNFDDIEKNNETSILKFNKSFLKKNKKNIIDIDYFIDNNFKEVFFKIKDKQIYLIDKNDTENKKIIAKKIRIENYTYFEE